MAAPVLTDSTAVLIELTKNMRERPGFTQNILMYSP
jgi:hypothetical protein